MPIASALTTLATIASIGGTVVGVAGALQSNAAQKKAERIREQQMKLESDRQRMQVVREANRQRGLIAATAAQQGSSLGSGAAGATAGVTGQESYLKLGINQAEKNGSALFAANRQDAAGRLTSSFGQGLSSLAGNISDSSERLRRLHDYYGAA